MGKQRVLYSHGPQDLNNLVQLVKEDWTTNSRELSSPGFQALLVYRVGSWGLGKRPPLRHAVTLFYNIVYRLVRNLYGIDLPRHARVGRRLRVAHTGIVLAAQASIGSDCTLRHNVTIGRTDRHRREGNRAPVVGNRVEFSPGVVAIGPVQIGNDVRLGPNSVIMSDIQAGHTVFASPSKILKPFGDPRQEPT